jgi:iron(III) transport system substrate-binding protein
MASGSARAAEADDAHWSQVVAAAKREGRVTLYSASVGTQEHVAIARAFEARYRVAVDILEARASEIRERNRVEAASGRRIADVMWNGSTSTGIEEAAGMLAAIGPLPRQNALLPQFDSDSLSIKLALTVYGLLINTSLVSDAAAPKSWRDLADPRWKGKILSDDMRALGGARRSSLSPTSISAVSSTRRWRGSSRSSPARCRKTSAASRAASLQSTCRWCCRRACA